MIRVNLFFIILLTVFLVLPSSAIAGDMVIENGSVFSETFVKDGRRIEVTKTYTYDGVTIHQLIYDAATGALIREKTTTNPLKDNVRIVGSGEQNVTNNNPSEVNESGVEIGIKEDKLEVAKESTSSGNSDVDIFNLEKNVGPESKFDNYQQMLGLARVDKVFVSQTGDMSEVAVNGVKNRRLLGFLRIEIPVEYVVDSETGEIKSVDQSLTSKLLEALSL